MKKTSRLVAFILVVVITVANLPVSVIASSMAHTSGNATYNTLQGTAPVSIGESLNSEHKYAVSLTIELKERKRSLLVKANAYSLGLDTPGGELVVTLYEKDNGIPKLHDIFTTEVQSGVLADTPDIPEASGVLTFADVNPEKLVVSAVICCSLDNPVPLSASVSYDVNGFIIVPASVSTLAATEVTKTSAVLQGKVVVEEGIVLNASDFGFIILNSLDSETEEEMDENGNPIGVILPPVQPATSITPDGHFSLTITNIEPGTELQYMAVSREIVPA